jgi:ribosomal protein L14E/L6E/L27E
MKMEKACIVQSLAGRDKGSLFLVKEVVSDEFVLLVDGKGRRIEKPKLKKQKHVTLLDENHTRIGDKIRNGEKVTNAEVRRALSVFKDMPQES